MTLSFFFFFNVYTNVKKCYLMTELTAKPVFQHTTQWSPPPSLHPTPALLFHKILEQKNQKKSARAWIPQTRKPFHLVLDIHKLSMAIVLSFFKKMF